MQLTAPPDQSTTTSTDAAHSRVKFVIVLAVTAVMTVLVAAHVHRVNGPYYWVWAWRHVPTWRVIVVALAAAPVPVAVWLWSRQTLGTGAAIALITLGSFAARITAAVMLADHVNLDFISYAVHDRFITGYFTDAAALSGSPGWLREYPQIMPILQVHTQSKPPGPVLFYLAFIEMFGVGDRAADAAAITLAVLTTLSVAACWWLLRVLARDETAAVMGAAFYSLCPGFVLFFPMFDPLYGGFVAAMLALWVTALERDRWLASVASGAMLAICMFFTFNFLVIGVFMIGVALIVCGGRMVRIVRHAAALAATVVVLYAIVWLACGYDPVATFSSAWRNQQALLALHAADRPYPATIWNDVADFALGSAWISFALAGLWIARQVRRGRFADRTTRIALLFVGQVAIVAVAGLLQSETARVWNFMLPLLALPVGLELASLPRGMRVATIACEIVLLAMIFQNMQFL